MHVTTTSSVIDDAVAVNRRVMQFHSYGEPEYERICAIVRDVYRRCYGAELTCCLPWLTELSRDAGRSLAVAGKLPAAEGRLFLEQYLDAPVERCIELKSGIMVNRGDIVEMGNFVLLSPFSAKRVFKSLCNSLLDQGYLWLTVTAVQNLHSLFEYLGLEPIILGQADRNRVVDPRSWGSYYDNNPAVLADYLPAVVDRLNRRLAGGRPGPASAV